MDMNIITEEPGKKKKNNTLLYIGIGAVLIVIVLIIIMYMHKKDSKKLEEEVDVKVVEDKQIVDNNKKIATDQEEYSDKDSDEEEDSDVNASDASDDDEAVAVEEEPGRKAEAQEKYEEITLNIFNRTQELSEKAIADYHAGNPMTEAYATAEFNKIQLNAMEEQSEWEKAALMDDKGYKDIVSLFNSKFKEGLRGMLHSTNMLNKIKLAQLKVMERIINTFKNGIDINVSEVKKLIHNIANVSEAELSKIDSSPWGSPKWFLASNSQFWKQFHEARDKYYLPDRSGLGQDKSADVDVDVDAPPPAPPKPMRPSPPHPGGRIIDMLPVKPQPKQPAPPAVPVFKELSDKEAFCYLMRQNRRLGYPWNHKNKGDWAKARRHYEEQAIKAGHVDCKGNCAFWCDGGMSTEYDRQTCGYTKPPGCSAGAKKRAQI